MKVLGVFVLEKKDIDQVFVELFGGVTIGPTHGIKVVVAVEREPCQFQPLDDGADCLLNGFSIN